MNTSLYQRNNQITEALLAIQSGENLDAVSQRLGISVGNIYNWRRNIEQQVFAEVDSFISAKKETKLLRKFVQQNRKDLKYSHPALSMEMHQKGIL